jgi:hypothetical protein
MEFQDFVNTTTDYLQVCKDKDLKVIKYKQYALIKTLRDKEYDYETYPWMRYCRGIIVDTKTNKVICVPPMKSIEFSSIDECYFPDNNDKEYSVLLDGTMINMFYHNDEWILSTRSSIGAKTRWDGKRTFADLFKEAEPKTHWREQLQTDHCYSFVLVHFQNRNVSPVNENGIFLVEQHKMGDTIQKVKLDTLEGVQNVISFDSDYLNNYKQPLYFSIKGVTIQINNKRYKWINPNFTYVSQLKMNHNNKLMNYISLRQCGKLKEYLQYFPEESERFNNYRDEFNIIKDDIFNGYLARFVYKTKKMSDISYPLRPLLYELHKRYLDTQEKTTIKVVSDYLHDTDGKRISFIHNHLFT